MPVSNKVPSNQQQSGRDGMPTPRYLLFLISLVSTNTASASEFSLISNSRNLRAAGRSWFNCVAF